MSMFSRGSKKRKDFVEKKMTNEEYTKTEATDEYMKQKKAWASYIIGGFKQYCKVLCDPKALWKAKKDLDDGCVVLWYEQGIPHMAINKVMQQYVYKNVNDGGRSFEYLKQVHFELGKTLAINRSLFTDPENFKSSMKFCGKGLSKLKHPIGSTALVKLGEKRERVVDCVDELARLMLNKTVQENAAILLRLHKGEDWPDDGNGYTYKAVEPKYVKL